MKILLFIWYAYATGMHFGTHFEILGGTLFGTQFTEKSTLGPEKYLVTLKQQLSRSTLLADRSFTIAERSYSERTVS